MKNIIMKKKLSFFVSVLFSLWLSLVCFLSVAYAEEKMYEGVGEYVMSDFETPEIAKQRAKSRAEQNAVEQAGVYVDSYTKTVNAVVVRDEITAIANDILRITDTKYTFQPLQEQGGSFLVIARIKAWIDTKSIDDWLKQSAQEKIRMTEQMDELLQTNKQLEKENAELKQQLAAAKSEQEITTIKNEMAANDKKFQANEKRKEALKLSHQNDYQGANALLTEAIALDPGNARLYAERGSNYSPLNENALAEADFSTAIKLDPDYPATYSYRAVYYADNGKPAQAIEDINTLFRLLPSEKRTDTQAAALHLIRGGIYGRMNQFSQATADFSKAIEMNPKDPYYYLSRAFLLYGKTGQYEKMLADANKAHELDPKMAEPYALRAMYFLLKDNPEPVKENTYVPMTMNIKHASEALAEVNQAIALNPKYALAYNFRGLIYKELGNMQLAQTDFARARELGYK